MTTQESGREIEREFRPAVRVVGEEVVYAASSLGSCIRALAAARQELDPYRGPLPENIAGTFQKGHDAEEYGKKWYRDRQWVVENEQKEVTLLLTGKLRIVGHIDFTVRSQNDPFQPCIVDTKRQNNEEFAKGSIRESWMWEKYEWQFNAYMLAMELPLVVQRVNDAGDVKLEMVSQSKTFSDMLRRVLQVEAFATKELSKEECDKDDFPCPYWRVLHSKDEVEVVEREDMELANLALHYKRLDGDIAPLQKRRGEIRKELMKQVSGRVRETGSGIEILVTEYSTKEKVIPAGKGTRVTVILPEGMGEGTGEGQGDTRPDNA